MTQTWIGRPLPRREDERFLTGAATYVADVQVDGLLTASFVRSPVAAAENLHVDVTAAATAPGVVAAYTADDLGLRDIPGNTGRGAEAPAMTRPPLARGAIRHVGEPLAVVIAEDAYRGADALELVDVTFDERSVVGDAAAALTDQHLVFPAAGSNVVTRTTVPEGAIVDLDAWPIRASVSVRNQRLAPVPIEALAILAVPSGDGAVTVYCGHQAPHRLRNQLSRLVGLATDKVRVVAPDVGGAFGMKGMLYPEYLVTVAAAVRLGRPVRWLQTRYEQFISGTHGRGMQHTVELAGDADGRIRAGMVRILAEVGAYPHNGSAVPLFSRYMAPGAYDIADFAVEMTMVVTNRAPTGSYRGAGRPEAAYAIERAIDAFAREVGMDPAEVRRRNFIRRDQMPYTTPTGALYDSGDYAAALERALELAEAPAVRAEQEQRRTNGGDPIGLGVGAFVERAGGAKDSSEYVRVEVDEHGRVIARAGTGATGQGHETAWSQIVASVLDIDPSAIQVVAGDTAAVADGTGSFASRSAQIAGSGLLRMADAVRQCACDVAAHAFGVGRDGVEYAGGRVQLRTDPQQELDLREIAAHAESQSVELAAEESYSPGAQTFPYGVCVAVVEVDRETGKVSLRRLVAVDDCGNVVNPLLVEGQVHGSLLQGLAQALFEGMEYDENGQPRTSTLAEYAVPTAPDAPRYTTDRIVSPAPSNPLGAKGSGESGCIGAPPAIVNAVIDALAPYGVHDLDMPLTPERVWRAMGQPGSARSSSSSSPPLPSARSSRA